MAAMLDRNKSHHSDASDPIHSLAEELRRTTLAPLETERARPPPARSCMSNSSDQLPRIERTGPSPMYLAQTMQVTETMSRPLLQSVQFWDGAQTSMRFRIIAGTLEPRVTSPRTRPPSNSGAMLSEGGEVRRARNSGAVDHIHKIVMCPAEVAAGSGAVPTAGHSVCIVADAPVRDLKWVSNGGSQLDSNTVRCGEQWLLC